MRQITTIVIALCGMAGFASGQGPSRSATPPSDQKKQIQEAAERLRKAQSNGQLDKAKETARGLAGKLPANLTEAAKAAIQSPEVKAQAAEAAKSLLPEAQRLMDARNAAQAPADSPPGAAAVPAPAGSQPPAAAPEGPQPVLLQPINQTPPDATAGRKELAVIESDNSVFDPNTGILIYTGNVRARHPQFYIECEELIVHLNQEEKATGKTKAAEKPKPLIKTDPILAPKKDDKASKPNNVKKAIASGPMVRIEKKDEQGKIQRAFCRNAVYEGASGIITMRDNPQVQTGNVMQVAITPDTVMTFDEKGHFSSNRRTRTVILSEEEGSAPSRNNL